MGRKFLAALTIIPCAASLASAQTVSMAPIRLNDPDVFRLLREVYPDLEPGEKATWYKGVRVLPNSVDSDADKPGTVDVDLRSASQAGVTVGAARYLFLIAENHLIAGQVAPTYRFLDAVAAQTDPGGPPDVSAAFALASGVPAIVVKNAHHNSQEGFVDYMLLGLVGDRLSVLYQGPSLYSVSSNDPACEEKVVTQQLDSFAPLPTSRDGFVDLSLKVVEQGECRNGGKATTLPVRHVNAVLTWNVTARKYEGGEKELASLGRRPQ
jgi:hypothetical protein